MKAVIITNILLLMSLIDKSVSKALGEEPRQIDLSRYGKEAFGSPDKSVGNLIDDWKNKNGSCNPEELGPYAEGDILFPSSKSRAGLIDKSHYWPDAVIPFEVVGDFDDREMGLLQQAMDDYHASTCIKFVRKGNMHKDYISIRNSKSGCWSSVGKIGGKQTVNLHKGCLSKVGTPIHELMHVCGFHHEQSREDRDKYVKILYSNINPKYKHDFEKAKPGTTTSFGFPYDYNSVMHYSAYAFSKNRKRTIKALRKFTGKMGQRDGFAEQDIKMIRTMYNCKSSTASTGYKVQVTSTRRTFLKKYKIEKHIRITLNNEKA